MTTAGLTNPLRQGGAIYDDLTKDYVGANGAIAEDDSGTATQGPALANGDCLAGFAYAEGGRAAGGAGIVPAHMPDAGGCGSATVAYVQFG